MTASTDGRSPAPARVRSRTASTVSGHRLPEERIDAGAMEAFLGQQQVERDAREVVGERLDAGIVLLVEDLAVGAARVAGFCAHRRGSTVDRVIGNALGCPALSALDPYPVPLAGAQPALQIAVA